MRRSLVVALNVVCVAWPAAAQHSTTHGPVRVIGVVRDPHGLPVAGAVILVPSLRPTMFTPHVTYDQITFTGKDGHFELARPVSFDSAVIQFLHLAYAHPSLRVAELPRTSSDSTIVVAVVDLQSAPNDTTPTPYAPPLRITASALPDAELDFVTRAARPPSRRDVARSSGDREIRVYIHGGDGTPERAAWLSRSRGLVSGEVWFFFMLGPLSLGSASTARGHAVTVGCPDAPWQWGTVLEDSSPAWRVVLVCRATLPVTPDWPGVWRRLDSLGVWRWSDQTSRPRNPSPLVRQGGVFVTLDMFDGKMYRRVRYGHSDSSAAPGAARAAAIARALDDAFHAVRYEPNRWAPPPPVTLQIAGTVRDTVGRPVAGALVRVPALPASVRTGVDGGFEVPFPVPNTASLRVESDGFLPVWYHVWELPRSSHGPGNRVRTEIVLQVAPVARDTIVVYHATAHDSVADTSARAGPDLVARAAPPWATRVLYGGGPSMGAPRSAFDGSHPPSQWCLPVGAWERASIALVTERLRDTTRLGPRWRDALGGAPALLPWDTLAVVLDETICQRAAAVINRDLLGWTTGPPVVLLLVKDRLVAFPANARMGEFGLVVHLDLSPRILGVASW